MKYHFEPHKCQPRCFMSIVFSCFYFYLFLINLCVIYITVWLKTAKYKRCLRWCLGSPWQVASWLLHPLEHSSLLEAGYGKPPTEGIDDFRKWRSSTKKQQTKFKKTTSVLYMVLGEAYIFLSLKFFLQSWMINVMYYTVYSNVYWSWYLGELSWPHMTNHPQFRWSNM